MDADSLTQIRQIVTEASQGLREEMGALRGELRQEIVSSSSALRGEMQSLRTELRQEIAATATTLREEMGGLRTELRQEMGATATTLREEMGSLRQEVSASAATLREDIADAKRHTGVLVEDLHHKLDLVVEGEQFHRQQFVDIRSEIHQESRDTRAMLQLSYHQLQERVENLARRLQTVEQHLGLAP